MSTIPPRPPGATSTALPPDGRRPYVAEYRYEDETGKLLYTVYRTADKQFPQRRGDGTWGLGDVRRVPFRFPQILKADPARVLFVPEGEKDVLNVVRLGLEATSNPGGGGNWKVLDPAAVERAFRGRTVILLPDNDDKGRRHTEDVAARLHGIALEVRTLALPGLPEKGDVSDWIAAGGTAPKLLELAAAAPVWWPKGDPADDAELMLSDVGNARRFVAEHGTVIRYVDDWSQWLLWDGRRWKRDSTREVEDLGKQTAARMFTEAAKGVAEASKDAKATAESRLRHARKSLDARAIQRMLALARSDPAVRLTPDVFDADPWALNTPTGTVDLRTGAVRPHRREDHLTKLCPSRFDVDARCPTWLAFLGTIFDGDAELIGFVRRLCGYTLTGDVTEQILLIFWGAGANGKSTYLEVVMDVVGADYAMKAPQNLLMARSHEAHPTERADLHGKRLVAAVETDGGQRLSESLVKELTGADKVRARRMRENFFEFVPTHKLILATNNKPVIKGTDDGIWRRVRLVPFGVRFWNPDEPARDGEHRPAHLKADKGIKAKLLAEREGILAWMVAGCREWQQAGGLGLPEAVSKATNEYRTEEDLIGQFVGERCETGRELRAKAGSLYAAFKTWCAVEGIEDHPSQRSFGLAMSTAGYERRTSNGTWYCGLRLRDEDGTLADPWKDDGQIPL